MNFYVDFEATQFSNRIISIGCTNELGEKFEDYTVKFEEEENFDAPTVKLDNGTLDFDNTIKYEKVKDLKLEYKYFEIFFLIH